MNDRKKPNYVLKSEALKSGLVSIVRNNIRTINRGYYENSMSDDSLKKLIEEHEALQNNELYAESCKIVKAEKNRATRLNKKMSELLTKSCIFLTLTFTDNTLASTSSETRRRYVHYYLKSQAAHFIANLDFGAKNCREHYHAVIQAEQVEIEPWRKFGALNVKKIHSTSNPIALSKYIAKLTNHAIKETTKRTAIIYSRD